MTPSGNENAGIQFAIDKVFQFCKDNQIFDPIEILRKMQKDIVTGRTLDVTDEAEALEGETNYLYIDRDSVLESAMEDLKLKDREELRKTLEIQWYFEVCKLLIL